MLYHQYRFLLIRKWTENNLGLIEDIVTEKAKFEPFGPFSALEYYPIEGYLPDFTDRNYLEMVKARLLDRLNYVSELDDFNKLPDEALNAIKKVTEEI